jgi:dTDP-4-dehydrorhamnose 3,5-epimerase
MRVTPTAIPEVLLLEPTVYRDERGWFVESYNQRVMREAIGAVEFVQDNHSHSRAGVLRGLHFQIEQPQGKLIRVVWGSIYDVAVDLRRSSPTFGKFSAAVLSADDARMLWIPPGFAHGFLVMSESADVCYKTTDYYAPRFERTLRWNDPALGIEWPLTREPVVAARDAAAPLLADTECYP